MEFTRRLKCSFDEFVGQKVFSPSYSSTILAPPSPWVYPIWDSLVFFDLGIYFLPHCRDVFSYYLLKSFLMAFLFVFLFWDSCDLNVGAFKIVPEVSEVVLIFFFILFPFFLSASFISTILSSTSLILSSASIILLLVPSRMLLISVIALFIIYRLFFIYSGSLLNLSCIFSILVSSLFICNSILFSRFSNNFYYYCSEFFFRCTPSLFLFCLVWWAFIMFLYKAVHLFYISGLCNN